MKPMRQTSAEEQRPPTPLLDSAAARLVKMLDNFAQGIEKVTLIRRHLRVKSKG